MAHIGKSQRRCCWLAAANHGFSSFKIRAKKEVFMFKRVITICIVSLITALVGALVFARDNKKITKVQVPKAVIAAFEKAYPKATVKEYEQNVKDKDVWYEIEYTDGAMTQEVKYTADGKLVGTSEDISPKDLPDAVSKAIVSKYMGAKIVGAEKEVRGEVVMYDVTLDIKGKPQEVKFSDKGEVIPKTEH